MKIKMVVPQTREEKINFLVNRDLDTVSLWMKITADWGLIESLFRHGFKGYDNFTDEELDAEIKEAQALND